MCETSLSVVATPAYNRGRRSALTARSGASRRLRGESRIACRWRTVFWLPREAVGKGYLHRPDYGSLSRGQEQRSQPATWRLFATCGIARAFLIDALLVVPISWRFRPEPRGSSLIGASPASSRVRDMARNRPSCVECLAGRLRRWTGVSLRFPCSHSKRRRSSGAGSVDKGPSGQAETVLAAQGPPAALGTAIGGDSSRS